MTIHPELARRIVAAYRRDSSAAVAAQFRIAPVRVRQLVREAGEPVRPTAAPRDHAAIIAAFEAGEPLASIAVREGVTFQAIHGRIKRARVRVGVL